MEPQLTVLHASVGRLRQIVQPLDDAALGASAYPSAWTIADVLSHIGSGAVIMQRRLADGTAGQETPDDFSQGVWDTWNAKSPRDQAHDAMIADGALLAALDSLTEAERERFSFSLGGMAFDTSGFVSLRLNEHALHTWDIAVALDPGAVLPADAADIVIDNLDLVTRFTARPTGDTATVTVRTSEPDRTFTIGLTPDGATMSATTDAPDAGMPVDLELPAEAFARLVYGRLDADHTPPFRGDGDLLATLRRVFPGL